MAATATIFTTEADYARDRRHAELGGWAVSIVTITARGIMLTLTDRNVAVSA
jgi:hypothetical protein